MEKDIKDRLEELNIEFQKMKDGELEGWSIGMRFKQKEECYDNGHKWCGGCSSDGYHWKEFCTNCFEERTRVGYPDWWFKPIR